MSLWHTLVLHCETCEAVCYKKSNCPLRKEKEKGRKKKGKRRKDWPRRGSLRPQGGRSTPGWRQKCHAYSTRPYRDTSHEAFPRLTTPHPSPLSSRCSKATDSSVQTPPIALARRCSEEQPQPACASRTHVSQHMEHAEKDVQHDARPRMSGLKGRHDEWRQTVVELSSLQLLCLHFATARLRWRKSCTRRTTS